SSARVYPTKGYRQITTHRDGLQPSARVYPTKGYRQITTTRAIPHGFTEVYPTKGNRIMISESYSEGNL
ncbi:MAG: hypothetical protein OXE78_10375, partial [Gammaproteobacteria bacterium]|nr:hypothetical protein [Gammaproteobacteria bacterium]